MLFVSLMSSGQFNFQQFKFVGGERVAGRKSGRVMRQYEGVAIIIFQLKYISWIIACHVTVTGLKLQRHIPKKSIVNVKVFYKFIQKSIFWFIDAWKQFLTSLTGWFTITVTEFMSQHVDSQFQQQQAHLCNVRIELVNTVSKQYTCDSDMYTL